MNKKHRKHERLAYLVTFAIFFVGIFSYMMGIHVGADAGRRDKEAELLGTDDERLLIICKKDKS